MQGIIDTKPRTLDHEPSAPKATRSRWVFVAVAAVLIGLALAAWIVVERGTADTVDPSPTAEMTTADKLEDLVNRGLIPHQALSAEMTTAEKLEDLVNRGLIPHQALSAEMTTAEKLEDLVNRGLIPRQALTSP